MESSQTIPQAVVIFADESAEWKVAGLRQLDRVTLAARDFFRRAGLSAPVPLILGEADAAEKLASLGKTRLLVLSTRLVPMRPFEPLILPADEVLNESHGGGQRSRFVLLSSKSDVARAEDALFCASGKPQDGVVSRYLNRPFSRSLSRLFVRTPISPNELTLLLFFLPILGACMLVRGDYFGFALGAFFFQIHSALDGCDGEIARVKYLESEAGAKLDGLCDRFSTLLFAVALGAGLARGSGNWTYLAGGIGAALFIGVTETFLTRHEIEKELAPDRYGNFLTARRDSFNEGDQLKLWMIKGTGLLSLGESAAALVNQLTKRDVFNFVFLLLVLCGLASWVLHILALCACLILVLALKEFFRPALKTNPAA